MKLSSRWRTSCTYPSNPREASRRRDPVLRNERRSASGRGRRFTRCRCWVCLVFLPGFGSSFTDKHLLRCTDPPPTFDPSSFLPLLLPAIQAFLPSSPASQPPTSTLLSLDLQVLSLSTQILASQTIASETFQLALFNHPFFISSVLQFIELVDLPAMAPSPQEDDEEDDNDDEEDSGKALSLVKGTLVSVVVAVMGEDEVGELVLGKGEGEGKQLRETLERWVGLAAPREDGGEDREDLGICAVLSLGNLARNGKSARRVSLLLSELIVLTPVRLTEAHCISLLSPPLPLLSRILALLSPKTDLKLQHALGQSSLPPLFPNGLLATHILLLLRFLRPVGLLKNLAIPDLNKPLLGCAGVAELVVGMGCLGSERDNVGSIQGGAVGILKFLVKGFGELQSLLRHLRRVLTGSFI